MSRDEADRVDRAALVERVREYLDEKKREEAEARLGRKFIPRAKRHKYFFQQWIAPYSGDTPPDGAAFRRTRCRNISTSGLAFIWQGPPDFDRILVKLGTDRRPIYVSARVVRTQPLTDGPCPAHLVGCQFTARVAVPESALV